MDASTIGMIAFAAVLIMLALRVPIAFTLASVATVATFFIFAFRTGTFMPERAIKATTSMVFSNSFDLIHSYDLSMIPLFVALGHCLPRGYHDENLPRGQGLADKLLGGVAMACHGLRRVFRDHRLVHRLRLDHGQDLHARDAAHGL